MDNNKTTTLIPVLVSVSSSIVLLFAISALILYLTGFFDVPNVDCKQSEWSACDKVTGKKTRTTLVNQSGNGKACGALTEDCPVACELSPWSVCDPATKKRKRNVITEAKNGGTACGSLEETCVIPFEATDTLRTAPQDKLNIAYLDRHPKICSDKPLSSYSLVKDGDKYKYEYKCANNLDIESKIDKTAPIANANNHYAYDIFCAIGEAISNYGFTRNPDKYEYTCLKSKEPITQCRLVSKPVDRNLPFEDNHKFTCEKNEVINAIRYINDTLEYTCCQK